VAERGDQFGECIGESGVRAQQRQQADQLERAMHLTPAGPGQIQHRPRHGFVEASGAFEQHGQTCGAHEGDPVEVDEQLLDLWGCGELLADAVGQQWRGVRVELAHEFHHDETRFGLVR
jgi:hypothetical protein